MKTACIVGTRPQFIKLAPLIRAINTFNAKHSPILENLIVHTGQHYDSEMDKIFFDDLNIPLPDYNLRVRAESHGTQTGEMLKRIEKVLVEEKPNRVIVFGDTNSTLAGTLAAVKMNIPVLHVEAGLRSGNRKMPEEINRLLTDHGSDVLFCPTEDSVRNLVQEGFTNIANEGRLLRRSEPYRISSPQAKPIVANVGDLMLDALLSNRQKARDKSNVLSVFGLNSKHYYLVTVHRPENTDNENRLLNIMKALIEISLRRPVVFPMHPRTRKRLKQMKILDFDKNELHFIDPLSYLDMIVLEENALKIITDSGGVQKEAWFLKVPCVTLREETEWKETTAGGNNVLVGADRTKIINETLKDVAFTPMDDLPIFGDGFSAERLLQVIVADQIE